MMYLPLIQEGDIYAALKDIRNGRAGYQDGVLLACALGAEAARRFNATLRRIEQGAATVSDADVLEAEFWPTQSVA